MLRLSTLKWFVALQVTIIFGVAMSACGDGVRRPNGSECKSYKDCVSNDCAITFSGVDFPGGICTNYCSNSDECEGGVCVVSPWTYETICLPECEHNDECREGYECFNDAFCAPRY